MERLGFTLRKADVLISAGRVVSYKMALCTAESGTRCRSRNGPSPWARVALRTTNEAVALPLHVGTLAGVPSTLPLIVTWRRGRARDTDVLRRALHDGRTAVRDLDDREHRTGTEGGRDGRTAALRAVPGSRRRTGLARERDLPAVGVGHRPFRKRHGASRPRSEAGRSGQRGRRTRDPPNPISVGRGGDPEKRS